MRQTYSDFRKPQVPMTLCESCAETRFGWTDASQLPPFVQKHPAKVFAPTVKCDACKALLNPKETLT